MWTFPSVHWKPVPGTHESETLINIVSLASPTPEESSYRAGGNSARLFAMSSWDSGVSGKIIQLQVPKRR